jgi:hypothetical protein
VTLPGLGSVAVDCRNARLYTVRLAADQVATDSVRVLVGGSTVRRRDVDPGASLTVHVPTVERRTAAEVFHVTPPITLKVVQVREPHTIRALLSLVLSEGRGGTGSCSFVRASLSLRTTSHVTGAP